jgi:MoaA/NifB/PqqE/SkfB family radical SAM enzyme
MDSVALAVEVAGCPTICRHCWAQGTRYRSMPIENVRWLVDHLHDLASHGVVVRPYPMHEVLAHPDAAEILRLFSSFAESEFEPLATTGVPLAMRDDWEDVLAAARESGTSTIWVALHGPRDEHERQAGRRGSFDETRLGVARARHAGFRVGCNVFLTRSNVRRFDELVRDVETFEFDELAIAPAHFYPTKRGRRYAASHPGLDDLLPVADHVLELTALDREPWREVPAYAETSHVRRALAGEWPGNGQREVGLVCRPNLDLHTGIAGEYGPRHGNLREDGVAPVLGTRVGSDPTSATASVGRPGGAAGARGVRPHVARVFERALSHGPVTADELFFPGLPVPDVRELAERYGLKEGREVHFWPESMRFRWLDRAAA